MRFALFLTTVLVVWLAEHLYVGWRLLSLPVAATPVVQRWLWVVLGLGFISYPLARYLDHAGWGLVARIMECVGALWMGTLFLLLAALLVTEVVTLGGLVLRPWVGIIRTGAAGVAVLAALVAVLAAVRPPRTLEVEVTAPDLPAALDGATIVQVSDLHLGPSCGRRRLRIVLARVRALAPDLVAVTGDLIDGDARAVEPFLPMLQELSAPLGVFAILGNHEYYAGAEASRRFLTEAGFTVLDNRSREVAPGLVVGGVADDRGAGQTGQPGADLAAALEGVNPENATVVLLQHSPDEEAEAERAGVDIMLNGHTHGGQIWPFHYLVHLAYPHLAGVYRVGSMTQVVSRGAGLWGPPMRLFAPADVVRVTLRAASEGAEGEAAATR